MGVSCSKVREGQSRVSFLYSGHHGYTKGVRSLRPMPAWALGRRVQHNGDAAAGGLGATSYIRFLCAGQEVRLRVHPTAKVTVAISDARAYHEWVTSGFESDALKTLVYEGDVASVAIDYCVKETGDFYLLILNESSNPVDITIEIVANRREPSARTRTEVTVNRLA